MEVVVFIVFLILLFCFMPKFFDWVAGIEKKHSQKVIIDNLKNDFNNDYIENLSFINMFPAERKEEMESIISWIYQLLSSSNNEPSQDDDVIHVFGGLQSLYISLWLAETGYGEKLALKKKQLIYKDDYGDICSDDWNKKNHFPAPIFM